ncbi:hypothetical protein [Lysobacter sp. Root494]|uniref:hypothetical protein n=1 Tax=Lysobacter sp. Root494 TaxID=1736549 RepID=UPI0006F3B819|nr:hypothetical protein [Lysobacter sp. Root494]KQY51771.1 hypothetical protein ASD14_03530 [Lysobacter sp. Root494]
MWRLIAFVLVCLCVAPAGAAAAYETLSCPVIPLAGDTSAAADNMRTRAPLPLKMPQRTTRYQIDAMLDPETHAIRGSQRVSWRNRSSVPVCALYLHMDLNAFESYGTRYMSLQRARGREPDVPRGEWGYSELKRVRQGGLDAPWIYVQPEGSPADDHTVVRVDLPQPVAPGEVAELEMDFAARLPGSWASTGRAGSFHLVSGWFPQIATLQLPGEQAAAWLQWNTYAFNGDYADREPADFDVHIKVPPNYRVAASGEPLGVALQPDHRDHHFVQQDAKTFAWAADSQFVQPLEYEYTPPNGQPLTLRVLYRLGNAAAAVRVLGTMMDALTYYSTSLGSYPTLSLTAVIAPRNAAQLAGQSFPDLFTASGQPSAAGTSPLDAPALAAIGSAYFSEGTDETLREGAWRYWADRYQRYRGQATAVPTKSGWLRRFFEPWRLAFTAQRTRNATRMDSENLRTDHVAKALHDVEMRIGTPAMDNAFRSWRRGVRAGYPDTSQTRWLLAEGSGYPDEFERAFAIMDSGIAVDDRIIGFSSDRILPRPGYVLRNGTRIELTETEQADARKLEYRTVVVTQREGVAVPQLLTVTFADGSRRSAQWNDTRTLAHFEWTTPVRAISVQLDPQRHVVLDRNKFDDGRTLAADTRPVRRWTSELAAMVQLAASWLVLV